jgi:hypothetical protein
VLLSPFAISRRSMLLVRRMQSTGAAPSLSGASSRTNAAPSCGSRRRALCFSPLGPARACRPPLFAAAVAPGEPLPQATRVVALMRLGASPTVPSLCSARSVGPKTARGRQPPSTSSTAGQLTTDGPPPTPNHPAATSSSTPSASCCSPTSPPAPATSPSVCHR